MSCTTCANCHSEIDETLDPPGGRVPCAECGATARVMGASNEEKVVARDFISVVGKRPGQKRPFVEDKSRLSFSRDLQKDVHRHTLIDRDGDKYIEQVIDLQTGELLHQCEEPLSAHQGHGDARKIPPALHTEANGKGVECVVSPSRPK